MFIVAIFFWNYVCLLVSSYSDR